MVEMGISGRGGRKRRKKGPVQLESIIAPNLLDRNFDVTAPNTVWAGDITTIFVGFAKMYLAVVIDLYSRKVVGWAIERRMKAELVAKAIARAVRSRRPPRGLIFHSDQGSQYTSKRVREQLCLVSIRQSMSRRGNCWDNAPIESFFATIKKELIYPRSWSSREQLERTLDRYIRDFYNRSRLHSTLGNLSPESFEQNHT
jgi:transposase InsO family protein